MKNHDSATIHIRPGVFRWAVVGSGWNAEELSEETGIKLESIQKWEKGKSTIGIADLKRISKVINRPLSVLLLPKPPDEESPPYYRMVDRNATHRISKKTLSVIRRARYVQGNTAELQDMRSEDARPKITHRTIRDDPEKVADLERGILDLKLESRLKGYNIDKFVQEEYVALREKIESFNILVMQMPMDIEEARGFSLSNKLPKLILVNSKDGPRPRLFTLLHEYAHLLLDTSGICPSDEYDVSDQWEGRNMQVERWCNNFAGAIIMPRKTMLDEIKDMVDLEPSRTVSHLTAKFCSSKMSTVVRILDLLGDDPRRQKYREFYETMLRKPVVKTGGGGSGDGRDMIKECIIHNGTRYIRLVVDSRAKDLITTNDMVQYLDLKTKYFEELEATI